MHFVSWSLVKWCESCRPFSYFWTKSIKLSLTLETFGFQYILQSIYLLIYTLKMSLFVLFCLFQWDLWNHGHPGSILAIVGKSSTKRGARALFCGIFIHSKISKFLWIKKLLLLLLYYILYYIVAPHRTH